jgi:hypothetical protein
VDRPLPWYVPFLIWHAVKSLTVSGDPCDTENDCDGDLICRAGSCANAGVSQPTLTVGVPSPILRTTTITVTATPTTPSNPTCEWTGHCAGAFCSPSTHSGVAVEGLLFENTDLTPCLQGILAPQRTIATAT